MIFIDAHAEFPGVFLRVVLWAFVAHQEMLDSKAIQVRKFENCGANILHSGHGYKNKFNT